MAILEYDRNPQLTADQKIQSLMESVQRAFNEVEQYTPNIQTIEVTPNGGGGTNEGRIIPIEEGGTGEDNQPDALAAILGNSVIPIAHGGTGATEALWARVNLGLGEVSTEDTLPVSKGGTGATGASAARSNLGLGSVATENIVPISKGGTGANSQEEALAAILDNSVISIANGGLGANTATQARVNLGLGNVAIEDIIPISKGGTGATTAEQALINLGINTLPSTGGVTIEQVWENVAMASTFAPQTIPVDLGENDYCIVRMCAYTGAVSSKGSEIIKCDETAYVNAFSGSSSVTAGLIYITRRSVTLETTGITFGGGYYAAANVSLTANNARAIPIDIYVIKGVQ